MVSASDFKCIHIKQFKFIQKYYLLTFHCYIEHHQNYISCISISCIYTYMKTKFYIDIKELFYNSLLLSYNVVYCYNIFILYI